MARISTYTNASPVTLSDMLIGTSVGATPANATKNFLVRDLLALFEGNITLEDVLVAGNTSTTSMILGGSLRASAAVELSSSVSLSGLSTYATNILALAGGLVINDVYKTATGELRIVV